MSSNDQKVQRDWRGVGTEWSDKYRAEACDSVDAYTTWCRTQQLGQKMVDGNACRKDMQETLLCFFFFCKSVGLKNSAQNTQKRNNHHSKISWLSMYTIHRFHFPFDHSWILCSATTMSKLSPMDSPQKESQAFVTSPLALLHGS